MFSKRSGYSYVIRSRKYSPCQARRSLFHKSEAPVGIKIYFGQRRKIIRDVEEQRWTKMIWRFSGELKRQIGLPHLVAVSIISGFPEKSLFESRLQKSLFRNLLIT